MYRTTLYATHAGFLPSNYVLYRDARLLLPFALSDKQSRDGLILRLPPAGVLSGKVLHYDGEVASQVVVEAYRGYYNRGRYVYDTAGRAMTNDRGEYRIYNLPAGKYYLAAIVTAFRDAPANLAESFATDLTGTRIVPLRSVTTFFPSSWKLTEATHLDLALGAEFTNMDITLARTRAATLSGRAISALSGRTISGTTISLLRADAQETGFLPARFPTKPLQDGTFEITGVVPGTYYIDAGASENQKPLRARQMLIVAENPEVKLDILMRPEVVIQGFVRSENKIPLQYSALRLTAEPRLDAPSKTVAVERDGSFKLALLPGFEYNLMLASAPDDVYLKAARIDASRRARPRCDANAGQ